MRGIAIHFGSHEWWVSDRMWELGNFQFPSFESVGTPQGVVMTKLHCVGEPGFGDDGGDCVMVTSNVSGSQVGVLSIFSLIIDAERSNPSNGVSPSLIRGELGVPVLGVKKNCLT